MENFINQLFSNPLYLFIGAILAIFLVIFLVKRVIKLIAFLAILLIGFMGYLYFTGQEVPTTAEELKESFSEQVDKVKVAANEAVDDAIDSAADDFKNNLTGGGNE